MLLRLLVVLALLVAGGAVTVAYRRRRARDDRRGALDTTTGQRHWPDLPRELHHDDVAATDARASAVAARTWVIFTTPLCVSCDAVRADLVRHEPDSRVLTIDATVRPDLSDRYGVQRAPTTILANRAGHIVERLVGPEGVRSYLLQPDRTALDA